MIRTLSDVARDDSRATLLAFSMILIMLCGYSLLFLSSDPLMLKLLTYAYLGGTVTVGAWLWVTNPGLYLGFAWWIWLLSALVRRIIDYEIGYFTPPKAAFVLLAPYIVTGLCFFDLIRYGKQLLRKENLPFALCLIGVFYGYLVGLPKVGGMGATVALLNWLCPIVLGFRMVALWKIYPRHRQVTITTFTWGVLLIGIYGVVQFFQVMPWDALWMESSGMTSIGRPQPFEVRVFGTLDSPGPMAMFMMAGLVVMFARGGVMAKLAAIPGFVAFLLTIVRGAWGGWVLAMGYTFLRGKNTSRAQLIGSLLLAGALIIPIAMSGQIGERTGSRMESFTELSEDGSLNARQDMYSEMVFEVIRHPIGEGLGGKTYDSGIINLLWLLGWPGGLLYLAGGILIVKRLLLETPPDKFTTLAGGVALSYAALMLMATQVAGLKGCIFWAFAGLVIAGTRYKRTYDPDTPEDVDDVPADEPPKAPPFDKVSGDSIPSSPHMYPHG